MKIFKHIWNLFFGSKKKYTDSKGVTIPEIENQEPRTFSVSVVISKIEKEDLKDNSNPITPEFLVKDSVVLNEEKLVKEPVLLVEKENISVFKNKPKNKRKKNVVGQKTLSEIKEYLLVNGSLDVITCEQKFKVKSLHNFIWHLRKDGLVFKTEKIFLYNEIGEKIRVTNYQLIIEK